MTASLLCRPWVESSEDLLYLWHQLRLQEKELLKLARQLNRLSSHNGLWQVNQNTWSKATWSPCELRIDKIKNWPNSVSRISPVTGHEAGASVESSSLRMRAVILGVAKVWPTTVSLEGGNCVTQFISCPETQEVLNVNWMTRNGEERNDSEILNKQVIC